MKQIEFNTSRVRMSQQFQHRQYQGMTIDVSLEVAHHDAEPEEIIAEGVKVIQAGFGLALWEILKRYDDGKSDVELQQMVNAIIPPALKVTMLQNEFIMDALYLEAHRRLEKEKQNA